MKSSHIKIGLIIFLFSVTVTLAFLILLALFLEEIAESPIQNNVYTVTLKEDVAIQFYKSGIHMLPSQELVPISIYNQGYLEHILQSIIPYAALFCAFLTVICFALWFVLRQIQEKSNRRIAEQFSSMEDADGFSEEGSALSAAYHRLRQKFDDHLADYKRLNSFLSHEQKNALSILRTRMELAGHQIYIPSLDAISQSIDDLLTLSEENDTVVTAPVDVALVCAAVCDNYQNVQKDITFSFDESDDTTILAKERWIYRAVANLVSNAVKYGKGKPITVEVKNKKNSVIVTVKDHGIGIAPNNQEKIFNHSYRVNELNKDGYGIGLSVVSHVCDLCGGFAAVDSAEGEGATFYLTFPHRDA